jgi:hypothetical protein
MDEQVAFESPRTTRIAAAVSLIALVALAISDFTLTRFWDHNAMATSVVADILVLIVGVAVLNEYLSARAARQWRLVADYALGELGGAVRHIWIALAQHIGVGVRADLTRDELRQLVRDSDDAQLEELALAAVLDTEHRRNLGEVVTELNARGREALAAWAPVMVSSGPNAKAISTFVELQAQLSALNMVLWEEKIGARPSSGALGDPANMAVRVRELIRRGSTLDQQLFAAVRELENPQHWQVRAPAEDIALGGRRPG